MAIDDDQWVVIGLVLGLLFGAGAIYVGTTASVSNWHPIPYAILLGIVSLFGFILAWKHHQ